MDYGWFLLGAIGLMLIGLAWRRWWPNRSARRPRRKGPDPTPLVEAALAAHGPWRCVLACQALEAMARTDEPQIHIAWAALELPLIQALPDCPPDLKPRLIAALEGVHRVCRHRGVMHQVMDMRNGLAGHADKPGP